LPATFWTIWSASWVIWDEVIEIPKIDSFLAIWWGLHDMTKKDNVIECDVVRPNELGSAKVAFEVGLLRTNFLFGVFFGFTPGLVIKVNCVPVIRNCDAFDVWALGVTVYRSP
jgi:hypothetical protein